MITWIEWRKTPINLCSNLVKNYQKQLMAVIENKGYTIDY